MAQNSQFHSIAFENGFWDDGSDPERTAVTKVIVARVLLFLALPFVFVGLVDPLEGGISLLIAGAIYAVAFWLLGKRPKRLLWVSYLVSIILGAIVLGYAMFIFFTQGEQETLARFTVGGVWFYRVAVLSTLAGGILAIPQAFERPKP